MRSHPRRTTHGHSSRFERAPQMRKYLKVSIVSGLVQELSEEVFEILCNDNMTKITNDTGLFSYIGSGYILIEDDLVDYEY